MQPTIFLRRYLYRLIKLNYISMFNSEKGGQINPCKLHNHKILYINWIDSLHWLPYWCYKNIQVTTCSLTILFKLKVSNLYYCSECFINLESMSSLIEKEPILDNKLMSFQRNIFLKIYAGDFTVILFCL